MAHILIVIGVVIAAALLFGGGSVLFYLVISSHEGYENEAGFHYGPEPFGRSGDVDCVPPAPRPSWVRSAMIPGARRVEVERRA